MSLTSRCRQQFAESDRLQGKTLFNQDRVELPSVSRDFAGVVVQGAEPYEVVLDGSDSWKDVLLVSCECPRFQRGTLCEHLWAAMIAVDAQDTELFTGRKQLTVQPMKSEDWFGETYHETAAEPPEWRSRVEEAGEKLRKNAVPESIYTTKSADSPRLPREAWYRLDLTDSRLQKRLVIQLWERQIRKDGTPGQLRRLAANQRDLSLFHDPEDRELLRFLQTTRHQVDPTRESYQRPWTENRTAIPGALCALLVPRLIATGRFGIWQEYGRLEPQPLTWENDPWTLVARGERRDPEATEEKQETEDTEKTANESTNGQGQNIELRIQGAFERGREKKSLDSAKLILPEEKLVLFDEALSPLVAPAQGWVDLLQEPLDVPLNQTGELLAELWNLPDPPDIELPKDLRPKEHVEPPTPKLVVRTPGTSIQALLANVSFKYGNWEVSAADNQTAFYDRMANRLLSRDTEAEAAAFERLRDLGLRSPPHWLSERCDLQLSLKKSSNVFSTIAAELIEEGWFVEEKGRRLRAASSFQMKISSGIDWFELSGSVSFGDVEVQVPELLAALGRGEQSIELGDGSKAMLPAEWLTRYRALSNLAFSERDGKMRFRSSQASLLDSLLEEGPQVDADEGFVKLRERMAGFDRIRPGKEPRGFQGTLRPYQCEGLGWLSFLEDLHLGGCLADDMGLGKTVQILALLQRRRTQGKKRQGPRPSLIVAPRSVVHNWLQEAERFAPRLEAFTYIGPDRGEILMGASELDLIITTYGLVLRDIDELKKEEFAYIVLDEAQAIKNPSSQTAKACRLLRGQHRLALTGTPVENHLGELWSIFEFLNPGMLGKLPTLTAASANRSPEPAVLEQIATVLKPFILRRTKQQVLKDLPPKTEQTLYCVLGDRQRLLYDQLREHYRASLMGRIKSDGLGGSKVFVLEALLRLRQAACHPALLGEEHKEDPSVKVETLMDQLEEVLDEGHKALVFSQFTRMLALIRTELDERKVNYEYLDGRTRQRQPKIDRFQNDPDCQLFLISLKAGGLGLNLTAADYVFLLDPWWNPAVEAQAIDRAHRMGQQRPVMAYRLIATDTVEEKIMELQDSKRQLADAILRADRSLIADLTVDDLELLLG